MLPKTTSSELMLLRHLEELIAKLDMPLTYVDLPGKGGLASYHGKKTFIVNRYLSMEDRIEVISNGLRKLDLQDMFLRPAVRKAVYGDE